MSEAEKRMARGREAQQAFEEAAGDLVPLVEMLRDRRLSEEIISRLTKVVADCDRRDYRAAGEELLRLTIGNAPWPIGITNVSIHLRAGRTRIEESKVQHIMKDETNRRFLTSFKRLMTRAQEALPAKPSKSLA